MQKITALKVVLFQKKYKIIFKDNKKMEEQIFYGLKVEVYRTSAGHNSPVSEGNSTRFYTLLLVGEEIPQVDSETDPDKVLILHKRLHTYYVKPLTITEHSVMGGNFVFSFDSRFLELSLYPIPVHDRVEYTDYDAKLDAKRERYQQYSQQASQNSQAAYEQARKVGDMIPFGQPILVGHHSEGRHRKDLNRIDNNMRKSVENQEKSSYYAGRAESVGKGGISSDDPNAIDKLKDKLQACIDLQERMKAANKLVRKSDKVGLVQMGFSEAQVAKLFTPDFMGRLGFADFQLKNNNAEIRRLEKRIEELEQAAEEEDEEFEYEDFQVLYNTKDNRVQIFFNKKPEDYIRTALKQHGFKWSRNNEAWQRHLNAEGKYAHQNFVNWLKIEARN